MKTEFLNFSKRKNIFSWLCEFWGNIPFYYFVTLWKWYFWMFMEHPRIHSNQIHLKNVKHATEMLKEIPWTMYVFVLTFSLRYGNVFFLNVPWTVKTCFECLKRKKKRFFLVKRTLKEHSILSFCNIIEMLLLNVSKH